MSDKIEANELLALTTDIVAAHVSNNEVPVADLPNLINQVYGSLAQLGGAVPAAQDKPSPAVAVRKSVTPDFIICLEDGKKLKMLKRYIRTNFSMTPDEYRAKWGLPHDYPMVAPNYAKQRSEFAKTIGLGRNGSRRRSAPA